MKHPSKVPAGAVSLALVLVGCGDGQGGSPSQPDVTGTTYYQAAKPILDGRCGKCHHEGGIGPFTLDSFAGAKEVALAVKSAVEQRTMPPWLASDGCAEYVGDPSLSDEQIATISAWVDEGAREGDPLTEAAKLAPVVNTGLSRTDRTLEMPVDYVAQVEPDDYRCFVIDWPETETTYVTGFRANPGTSEVVHHVIAFLIEPADVAAIEKLDAGEEGAGYTCYGGPGNNEARWIGSWAPGGLGYDFVPGTGIEIVAGAKVVLQVHYNTLNSGALPDRTSIELKLDATVERKAWVQPWANPSWLDGGKMIIPAMTDGVGHEFGFDPTPFLSDGKPLRLYSAALHMHVLGQTARTEIRRADGSTECLLDIPRWDFHWQGAYRFAESKLLSPGDELHLQCTWDNPTNKDVDWGEGTTDEMCLGAYYLAIDE
ncbi:MAG: monooxygenase [Myxococcales bacterium]|nr:monooxygenase [Myxococcales bacterium]